MKIYNALKVKEKYEIDLPFFSEIGASVLTDKSIKVPTNGLEDDISRNCKIGLFDKDDLHSLHFFIFSQS
jgi:7-cyano-7-deazaguanine synthase in queuosine biosynthesis